VSDAEGSPLPSTVDDCTDTVEESFAATTRRSCWVHPFMRNGAAALINMRESCEVDFLFFPFLKFLLIGRRLTYFPTSHVFSDREVISPSATLLTQGGFPPSLMVDPPAFYGQISSVEQIALGKLFVRFPDDDFI
jgi:hypothetical protein